MQTKIAELHQLAGQAEINSKNALAKAEEALLQSFGLANWETPEPLELCPCHSSEAFAAGRLDADYFRPRVLALMDLLGRDGLTLGEVAPLARNFQTT